MGLNVDPIVPATGIKFLFIPNDALVFATHHTDQPGDNLPVFQRRQSVNCRQFHLCARIPNQVLHQLLTCGWINNLTQCLGGICTHIFILVQQGSDQCLRGISIFQLAKRSCCLTAMNIDARTEDFLQFLGYRH